MRILRANGGHIEDDDGRMTLVLDEFSHSKIMRKTGRVDIPKRIPITKKFCNPTWPILAPLGGYFDPVRRLACWPTNIPYEWQMAWALSG